MDRGTGKVSSLVKGKVRGSPVCQGQPDGLRQVAGSLVRSTVRGSPVGQGRVRGSPCGGQPDRGDRSWQPGWSRAARLVKSKVRCNPKCQKQFYGHLDRVRSWVAST